MKNIKYILITLIIFLVPVNIFALEKEEVTLSKCVDGDTAKFIYNNEEIKVRFLAVDTPETKHPTKGEEPYGKEASNYTCDRLTNGKKIELEFDENSDKTDKYNRYLAWIFVDDSLLQAELVKEGLAEVAYLYGDYKYTSLLKDYEQTAIANKVGMYSDTDTSSYTASKNNSDEDDSSTSSSSSKSSSSTTKIGNHTLKYYIKKIINEIIDELLK
jgi:micrococcal nuclease